MKEYVKNLEPIQKTDELTDFVGMTYGYYPAILAMTGNNKWHWIDCDSNDGYFDNKSYDSIAEAVKVNLEEADDVTPVHIYTFDTKKEQFIWAISHM